MKNKIILSIVAMGFVVSVHSQSTMEKVLSEISVNNKTIHATKQYLEAQKLHFKTGLTPENPELEYDFLVGSPSTAGNQHDFTFLQSFDFPTTYVKKGQLAKQQSAQTAFQLEATRQDILLEAKKICIQLIYQNKLRSQLSLQKANTEKFLADYQKKLDKGDGNILDVNKAKLRLIDIKKTYQQSVSEIAQLNEKLTALNGGKQITFSDTVYLPSPVIPSFEKLENDYENVDPVRKSLQQEKVIAQHRVAVSRTLWLPKFELGYHYQGILGQTFNGIHTGLTLPLWQNKNAVKANESRVLYADLELQDHLNAHYYEIKVLYDEYINLQTTLTDYQQIFSSYNNTALLNKALNLGEISILEYFLETGYYNDALYSYLEVEKEYHLVLAELFKYRL